MEIRSNNKAKHRSQKLAFGIFRLLSLCIVLILFAILGFIVYKGIGAISWDFITSAPTDGMTGGGIWPALFLLGVVLFFITLIINFSVEYISSKGLKRSK